MLSDPGKDGRRWDVRRFFQTGLNELALVFYELESHGIQVARDDALDFGCGVGRLTQALAERFERVVGVDVSPRMIEAARSLNRFPDRVSYASNAAPNLRRFSDEAFDFVYTEPGAAAHPSGPHARVLREFVRVLEPGGLLVFQLPSHERPQHEPPPSVAAAPMPDEAYRAGLSLEGLPRGAMKPATPFTLTVGVTNLSLVAWSFEEVGAITAGNRWRDRSGERVLRRDDGRTPLPRILAPGATCWIPLTINAPADEGEYQCEFDLAHEGIRWFEDRGSKVVRTSIAVQVDDAEDSGQSTIDRSQAHAFTEHDPLAPTAPVLSPAPGDRTLPIRATSRCMAFTLMRSSS